MLLQPSVSDMFISRHQQTNVLTLQHILVNNITVLVPQQVNHFMQEGLPGKCFGT